MVSGQPWMSLISDSVYQRPYSRSYSNSVIELSLDRLFPSLIGAKSWQYRVTRSIEYEINQWKSLLGV